ARRRSGTVALGRPQRVSPAVGGAAAIGPGEIGLAAGPADRPAVEADQPVDAGAAVLWGGGAGGDRGKRGGRNGQDRSVAGTVRMRWRCRPASSPSVEAMTTGTWTC